MARYAPLESSWSKFRWASKQLDALNVELGRLVTPENQTLSTEREIKEGVVTVRVTRVPDFREAGLILGDSVNNYRSVLDHLMWDLVKLGSHGRLSAKEAKDVQFPYANKRRDLTLSERHRRGPGVSPEHWKIIGRYQPYSRGDRGRTMRFLNRISNMDKHRTIVPAAFSVTGFHAVWKLSECVLSDIQLLSTPKRVLQVGTKLASARITPTGPEPNVEIESQIAVQPSLSRGVPVLPSMLHLHATVKAILSDFERAI
jgi:hypothetical protein